MSEISFLCVTKGDPRAESCLNHLREVGRYLDAEVVILTDGVEITSKGYVESVLDEALTFTHHPYVLRIDDDERLSAAMVGWLEDKKHYEFDNWHFPRIHLWGNPWTAIIAEYYFPDWQTRLSTRDKFSRGADLHVGSPHPGKFAPVALEHWVYLDKTYEERLAIGRSYLALRHGGDGGEFRASSIEDEKRNEEVIFAHYTSGYMPINENHKITWPGATWHGPLDGTRR